MKLRSVEGYPKDSYAIINVDCAIKDGDLVLCGTGRLDELLRVDCLAMWPWKKHMKPNTPHRKVELKAEYRKKPSRC